MEFLNAWVEIDKDGREGRRSFALLMTLDREWAEMVKQDEDYRDTRVGDLNVHRRHLGVLESLWPGFSQGGYTLTSERIFPIGSYLLMDVEIPGQAQGLRVLALVLRPKDGQPGEPEQEGPRRMGLHLVAFHRRDLERLDKDLREPKPRGGSPALGPLVPAWA